jgi:hypothetical protein
LLGWRTREERVWNDHHLHRSLPGTERERELSLYSAREREGQRIRARE